jgi:3-deoxy-7-phosphoheptulonate synthase
MLIIMDPNTSPDGAELRHVLDHVRHYPGVSAQVHNVTGATRSLTEVYLIGRTDMVPKDVIELLPGVERVVRISEKYRVIGRHQGQVEPVGFVYNGLTFDQDALHVFAGLCAVDAPEHVETMMAALQRVGVSTTRMGAYKPRTSPYDFQGHGRECLPYVFDLAGRYGIRVIAMEIVHENQLDEIREALERAGKPTGVMLQVGTRNAQNFELLKYIGQQQEFPVLFKRGMGITLEESLNACEYIASEGNRNIIFCLRGVKTHLGDPHRNLVDFSHVSVVRRLTRMPVCIDPSHSVGKRDRAPDGLLDIYHTTAQGVIAGANMILVDFHPSPEKALCDGPQALVLDELSDYLADVKLVRDCYEARRARARARKA